MPPKLAHQLKEKEINLSNDKQGRIVWKCPKCNHTLVTFYSEVETIRNIDECKYCGQKLIMPGEKHEQRNKV